MTIPQDLKKNKFIPQVAHATASEPPSAAAELQ